MSDYENDPYQEYSDETAMILQEAEDEIQEIRRAEEEHIFSASKAELKEAEEEAAAVGAKRKRNYDNPKEFICVTCFSRRGEIKNEKGQRPTAATYVIRSVAEKTHWESWHSLKITQMYNPDAKEPEVIPERDVAGKGKGHEIGEKIARLRARGVTVQRLTKEEAKKLEDLLESTSDKAQQDAYVQHYLEEARIEAPRQVPSSPPPKVASDKARELALSVLGSDSLVSSVFTPSFLSSVDSALAGQPNSDLRLGLTFLAFYSATGQSKSREEIDNRGVEFLRAIAKHIRVKRAEIKRSRADLFNKYSPMLSQGNAMIIEETSSSSASSSSSSTVHFDIEGFKRLVLEMEQLSLLFVVAFQWRQFVRSHEARILDADNRERLFAALQETALLAYNVAAYEYALALKDPNTLPSTLNSLRNEGRKSFAWIKEIHGSLAEFGTDKLGLTELSRLFGFVARSYVLQHTDSKPGALLSVLKADRVIDFTGESDVEDLRKVFYLVMAKTDRDPLTPEESRALLDFLVAREWNYSEVYQNNFANADVFAALCSYLFNALGPSVQLGAVAFWYETFYVLAIRHLRMGAFSRESAFSPPLLKKEDLSALPPDMRRGIELRFSSVKQEELGESPPRLEEEKKSREWSTPARPSKRPVPAPAVVASIISNQEVEEDTQAPLSPGKFEESERPRRRIIEESEDEQDQDDFGATPEFGLKKPRAKHELYFGHHNEWCSLRPESRF